MDEPQPYDEKYADKIEKMVALTVAGARGLLPLGQVLLPLGQIAGSRLAPPEVRTLARSLARILHGERDPSVLTVDLSPELAAMLRDALAQISAPPVTLDNVERQAFTFEELLEQVSRACTGEVLLWQRLWDFTGTLAADESLPPEIQALGLVLRKILAGERQKHILTPLAPEHRGGVEQLVVWLAARAVAPPQSV